MMHGKWTIGRLGCLSQVTKKDPRQDRVPHRRPHANGLIDLNMVTGSTCSHCRKVSGITWKNGRIVIDENFVCQECSQLLYCDEQLPQDDDHSDFLDAYHDELDFMNDLAMLKLTEFDLCDTNYETLEDMFQEQRLIPESEFISYLNHHLKHASELVKKQMYLQKY